MRREGADPRRRARQGGGVKLSHSPEMARDMAKQILGMQLVTHQTGPEGQLVRKVHQARKLGGLRKFLAGLSGQVQNGQARVSGEAEAQGLKLIKERPNLVDEPDLLRIEQ